MKIDMVERKRLVRDPLNLRTEADLIADRDLRESIRAHGILQPLLGRRLDDGRISVINGGRRLACAEELAIERLPVVVLEGDVTIERILVEQFAIDLQHKPLNAMEHSDGLAAIQKATHCSVTELGVKVGMSQPWTSTTLSLQKLDPAIQQLLRTGQIKRDRAVEIASKATGSEDQHALLKQLAGLTREQRRRRMQSRGNEQVKAKVSSVRLPMPGQFVVSVKAPSFDMPTLYEVLQEAAKLVKKAMNNGHDTSSIQRHLEKMMGGAK